MNITTVTNAIAADSRWRATRTSYRRAILSRPCVRHSARVEHIEILLLALLVATAALAVLANRVGVPYPIVLVVGGSALGFVPGVPEIELAPDQSWS